MISLLTKMMMMLLPLLALSQRQTTEPQPTTNRTSTVRQEGEECGSCYCPPTYKLGDCAEGLTCVKDPNVADGPGICKKGPLPIEKDVIFEENGRKFKQHDSYNSEKKEAVITVEAHGDFMATKFIMKGRSSESAVAGKMVVSSESVCSLEDIPADINPEDMILEVRNEQVTHETEEVKMYQIRSETREATQEELENLSESMKNECAGKRVMVSSTKTIDETEFIARNFANFANYVESFKKGLMKRQASQLCRNLFYGCALSSPTNCVRWTYNGLGPTTAQPGYQPLIHLLDGSENYCTRCCPEPNTAFVQCSCINNAQSFSTAFAISQYWNGLQQYDCIKRSRYCKWDNTASIQGCNYNTNGACIDDGCPVPDCDTQQECNDG